MPETKISPAFERFFADGRPGDRHEAIVVYRAPAAEAPLRGRLRALKSKLDHIERRAAAQRAVEHKLLKNYERHTPDRYARTAAVSTAPSGALSASTIGEGKLPCAMVQVTPKSLYELADKAEVVAILPNQKIHLIRPKEVDYHTLAASEKKQKATWGLMEMGIPEMWKKTKGKGVTVGVLDTGVHGEHPALKGRVKDFAVVDPLGRRITASPMFDCGTHGTHVCGTIAGGVADGVAIGVAPEASLCVAAVLVGDATVRTLLEGIAWAVEKGADIINMSLGFDHYEPLFAEIFKILVDDYGVLPVVAIGNENHGNTSSPGNCYNAFSVGALEKGPGKKREIAFFSSGASLVFPGGEPAALVNKPDVVAPGVQVFSCIPPEQKSDGVYEYSYMDGTSMATPHVSGVAALLMAARPTVPVTEIANALRDTARHPVGRDLRPDNRWGYGLVRPKEALKALD
jgi:serine protease AprX